MEPCLLLSNGGSIVDHVIAWNEIASWGLPPNPHNKILILSADRTVVVLSKALSLEGERCDGMGTLGIALCQNGTRREPTFVRT